jgi:hypothetical protein
MGPRGALSIVLCSLFLGCAARESLISPQEAQDRIYDHMSRAEAFRLSHNSRFARIETEKARRYRELIRAEKTTTPEQARAAAAEHRRRAEALRSKGYTRYVDRELEAAQRYEDFARRASVPPPKAE